MFGTIRAKLAGEFIILVGLGLGIGYSSDADDLRAIVAFSVCAGIMAHMMWRTVIGFERARRKK